MSRSSAWRIDSRRPIDNETTRASILSCMITRDDLEEMFVSARARAKWNIDDVCLWGYFFTDHDRNKLSAAASVLKRMGYRVVGFLEPAPDDEDQGLLFLHVEREEVHTVESLDTRNHELYQFADKFALRVMMVWTLVLLDARTIPRESTKPRSLSTMTADIPRRAANLLKNCGLMCLGVTA